MSRLSDFYKKLRSFSRVCVLTNFVAATDCFSFGRDQSPDARSRFTSPNRRRYATVIAAREPQMMSWRTLGNRISTRRSTKYWEKCCRRHELEQVIIMKAPNGAQPNEISAQSNEENGKERGALRPNRLRLPPGGDE